MQMFLMFIMGCENRHKWIFDNKTVRILFPAQETNTASVCYINIWDNDMLDPTVAAHIWEERKTGEENLFLSEVSEPYFKELLEEQQEISIT